MAARIAEFTVARSRRFACMRGADVDEAVLEPDRLVGVGAVVDRERRRLRGGEHLDGALPSSTAPVAILSLTVPLAGGGPSR